MQQDVQKISENFLGISFPAPINGKYHQKLTFPITESASLMIKAQIMAHVISLDMVSRST